MKELTLNDLAQSRGPGQLHDSKFMPAAEKAKVLKQWEGFLKSGLEKEHFTKLLYHHLIQHCSFIAHYDKAGFFGTYFDNQKDALKFFSQFDKEAGCRSIEYGADWWMSGDYEDINNVMCEAFEKIKTQLIPLLKEKVKNNDINMATQLLAKHGLTIAQQVPPANS